MGKHISPHATSAEKITFKDIRINSLGHASFSLGSNNLKIFEFEKYAIRPWVSILPPIIAIALAFLTKSIVPSLFVAIWFGAWAVNGLTFGGIFTGLLDTFNVFILNTILDKDHAVIGLFTLMLGGMVGIIYRNGGMHGIIQLLIKKQTRQKKGRYQSGYLA